MTDCDEAVKQQLFRALQVDGKKTKTTISGRHSKYVM